MRNNVSERVTSLRTLTLMTDPSDMQPELDRFKAQTGKYDALQQKLTDQFAIEASPEEKALLGQIKEAEGTMMPAVAKASALYLANNAVDATRVMVKEIRPGPRRSGWRPWTSWPPSKTSRTTRRRSMRKPSSPAHATSC